MCEGSALRLIILSILHQGMYIKSTYDGLHVITGTTEGVSGVFFSSSDPGGRCLLPGFPWDDAGLSPPNSFIAAVKFVVLLVDTDTKISITPDQFTALLLLSVCSVSKVSS